MIWRTMTRLRSALAVALALAVLEESWVSASPPVEVTDYPGLVATVGSADNFETGERFTR